MKKWNNGIMECWKIGKLQHWALSSFLDSLILLIDNLFFGAFESLRPIYNKIFGESKMKQIIIFIGILLMFAGQAFTPCATAQTGYAGMPGSYLHMGVGARAMGMGKAYTALASDPTAVYWNPAGLATQDPYQIYVMHSTLFLIQILTTLPQALLQKDLEVLAWG